MTEPLWLTDPMRCLIDPIDAKTFFDDYHEKKALIVHREDPGRYLDLLSIERIDDIVANRDLRSGQLDMARSEPPVSPEQYTFETGYIDRGGVAEQYRQGATIILPQLHMNDAVLGEFCRNMENLLSCQVQTNIYLTPPHNQGFRTHYDDHDVFVLQVSGEKYWRLYDTPVENPYRGEGFRPEDHAVGEPVEEFVLKAGECAYVPRGLMHDASTHGEEASLHITLGLIVKTWADLMLEAVSEVALNHSAFRRALPVGFARPDFERDQAETQFKELLGVIAKEAELESSMDLFVDTFIRSRMPATAGTIADFNLPKREGQAFKLRRFAPWRLAGTDKSVVIITAGGEVHFPLAAEPALHTLLDGGVVSKADFTEISDEEANEVIGKLYAFGLIVPAD
ncbi:cupin domain-containing protein [Maricaulis parjimensis]|uniref:cupin domain-containing protein n=1 Tax=Maricaulis parjimensis TaxID=144023 RepID=UPI00193954B9|nr:cupin domain-containing protein [Maricaulis parjimensis]